MLPSPLIPSVETLRPSMQTTIGVCHIKYPVDLPKHNLSDKWAIMNPSDEFYKTVQQRCLIYAVPHVSESSGDVFLHSIFVGLPDAENKIYHIGDISPVELRSENVKENIKELINGDVYDTNGGKMPEIINIALDYAALNPYRALNVGIFG